MLISDSLIGIESMMPDLSQVIEIFSRYEVLFIVLGFVFFCVWLITIIDIVGSDFKINADKIIWFFFTILIPPVGILLYCFIGRKQKTDSGVKDEPHRSRTRYRDIGRDD
jgi:hypothetical protein